MNLELEPAISHTILMTVKVNICLNFFYYSSGKTIQQAQAVQGRAKVTKKL